MNETTWLTRSKSGITDTIFAVATASGRAALAVIRISGPAAGAVVESMCGRRLLPRRAALCKFVSPANGDLLDRGLAIWFPSPASFTGEDCAELHCHGASATLRAISDSLRTFTGVRHAEPGEFTRRAVCNGKMDIAEAAALADLIDAQTEHQRRQALRLMGGELRAKVSDWQHEIVDLSASLEARIDFADEGDVADIDRYRFVDDISRLIADVEYQIAADSRALKLREGFVVAICGPPNSGKSTLLNALAGREQALVSPHAGTTRDIVEVQLELEGHLITLWDTAGIRDSREPVERMGIDRSRRAANDADLVVWLESPGSETHGDLIPGSASSIRVFSKEDILPLGDGVFQISAKTGFNLDRLAREIGVLASRSCGDGSGGLFLREDLAREARVLLNALKRARQSFEKNVYELSAACLFEALEKVSALGAPTEADEVLDAVFSRFCIGK